MHPNMGNPYMPPPLTSKPLFCHQSDAIPSYNGPHQPIVHAAGCLSAIVVGPIAFNVYCKLDAGLDP